MKHHCRVIFSFKQGKNIIPKSKKKKKFNCVFSPQRVLWNNINYKGWPVNSPISPAIVCWSAINLSPETHWALTLTSVNPKLRIPSYMYELHVGSISEKSTMQMYYNKMHTKMLHHWKHAFTLYLYVST